MELIKNLHQQWREAKEQLRQRCEACGLTEVSAKLAECRLFSGNENIEELAALLMSPQGIEFALSSMFPSLETLRMFKHFAPERFGIYIDAGEITLDDPGNVVLAGVTKATVKCRKCQRNMVAVMHGASAEVIASGWSLVKIEKDKTSHIHCVKSEKAILL